MNSNSIKTSFLILFVALALSKAYEDKFKINKLNLIWNKAQHSLGPSKLKDLSHDLSEHQKDELSLKKMKAHGQDKDGIFEATVRKKLLMILKKHSLERYLNDIVPSSSANLSQIEGLESPGNQAIFRDSKLDKLWKKAEKAGFTQEQLMVLHEEFQHHQDKLDGHYETLNGMEMNEDFKETNELENSIESAPDEASKRLSVKPKSKEYHGKRIRLSDDNYQGLKDKHSALKKDYEELTKKIAVGSSDIGEPFQDAHVNELWSLALQSNFSQDELVSLKEELLHYQTRIMKLKHFQNQLERHDIKSKDSYGEDAKEVKHIRKKIEDLTQKVAKTHESISMRISREELR